MLFISIRFFSFNPLWINTALKLIKKLPFLGISFNPLWINTALKRQDVFDRVLTGFNPLWINTALKPLETSVPRQVRFNPLWFNTALKLCYCICIRCFVSIPYGLTLLSNGFFHPTGKRQFQSPMD